MQSRLIECPRDAWQSNAAANSGGDQGGLPARADSPPGSGISTLSLSFLPAAVPQMADCGARVLGLARCADLDADKDVEIIAIVVNQQGAERAVAQRSRQHTWAFRIPFRPPFSSATRRQTEPAKALAANSGKYLRPSASRAGLGVVAYLSMAFGNPYGDPWGAKGCDRGLRDPSRQLGLKADLAGRHRRAWATAGADRVGFWAQ